MFFFLNSNNKQVIMLCAMVLYRVAWTSSSGVPCIGPLGPVQGTKRFGSSKSSWFFYKIYTLWLKNKAIHKLCNCFFCSQWLQENKSLNSPINTACCSAIVLYHYGAFPGGRTQLYPPAVIACKWSDRLVVLKWINGSSSVQPTYPKIDLISAGAYWTV